MKKRYNKELIKKVCRHFKHYGLTMVQIAELYSLERLEVEEIIRREMVKQAKIRGREERIECNRLERLEK